ncbi:hypothetical protein BGZ90_003383 [Linnemannia elongata]|nr:hypothetical protein BGZ90_003383 [Linnemannia elongata]
MLNELPIDKCDGFPDHPHLGFKTMRYMLGGPFQKDDFAGHKVTIGPDDLQWMTAGRDIVHSTTLVKSKNRVRKLQLWINLAKEHMMRKPQYQKSPVVHAKKLFKNENNIQDCKSRLTFLEIMDYYQPANEHIWLDRLIFLHLNKTGRSIAFTNTLYRPSV